MKITIYSTASCGFCKMLKRYLEEKNFTYEEKMADANPETAQELYDKSHGFAVPFTIVEKDDGSNVEILGFDVAKVNSALGIN